MATYKGISYPDHVAPLARHMHSVNDHREALAALSSTWDTLALLAHLSNLKADMTEVRASFAQLTNELLVCLAEEMLELADGTLGHQAQIAVDVLTRNLFERTADIGFLATDSAIVDACVANDPAVFTALRERLLAYAARYTVYRDIVLLAPDGQVLTRLVEGFDGRSASPLMGHALRAQGGFVETFAPTDFCGDAPALTYAWRVEQGGRPVGVLALVFDLEREAAMIFERLASRDEVLAFVDAQQRVVVSNDAARLPPGHLMALRAGSASLRLGGVTHLVTQRQGRPYQGYAGPGWSSVALAPVELAFGESIDESTPVAFSGEDVFSARLLDVPVRAREIQRRLDRMVWNGRIHQANESNAFSRSLLEEIAGTGRKTKDQFERASAELLTTVASGLLGEARFLADLAVDVLDRNLYERANDCRWWATSPVLATMDAATARKTLAAQAEGRQLTQPWVAECLRLRDPMRYAVSPFEPSELYDGVGTYVYAAPVLAGGQAVGGVALVFDSTPQFEAMLRAALPPTPGSMAAFCRPDGATISRTAELPMALPAAVLSLAPGQSWSGMLAEGDRCFLVGATAGSGYREFKTSDGYAEPVIGVVVIPCGSRADRPLAAPPQVANVPGGAEIATFLIGEHLMGVPAGEVIECIEVTAAVRVWRGGFAQRHVGFVTWNDMALPLVDICADVQATGAAQRYALVLCSGTQRFGLLVSELGPVADMKLTEERGLTGHGDVTKLISQLARSGSVFIPVLSPDAVFAGASS
jgi:chemotaxis signal transduction protein